MPTKRIGTAVWIAALGLATGAAAAEVTLTSSDKGRYKDDGQHDAASQTCVAGRYDDAGAPIDFTYYTAFLVFDLSPVSFAAAAGSLTLPVEAIYVEGNVLTQQTFTVCAVTNPPAVVTNSHVAGNPEGIRVFADLGTGTVYGVGTVLTTNAGKSVAVTLTAEALADLNAAPRGPFAMGIRLEMQNVISFSQYVRFSLNGSGTHQLTLRSAAVNQAPTNVLLSGTNVAENLASGTRVGSFGAQDPDAGDTFTYALAAGTGGADNGSFAVAGSNLTTAAVFNYEVRSNYSIRVQATDQGGLSTQKVFGIRVGNVDEPAPAFAGAPTTLADGRPVIRWSSLANHRYTVHAATNLRSGFSVVQSGIPGTSSMNAYTDSTAAAGQRYWKISTEP